MSSETETPAASAIAAAATPTTTTTTASADADATSSLLSSLSSQFAPKTSTTTTTGSGSGSSSSSSSSSSGSTRGSTRGAGVYDKELDLLRREVHELRAVTKNHPDLYQKFFFDECKACLRNVLFFKDLDDTLLREVAMRCKRVVFEPGTILARENEAWDQSALFLVHGEVERWTEVTGHHVKVKSLDAASVGTMHLLLDEPWRFNVICETEVVAYEMTQDAFMDLVKRYPQVMLPVAKSLAVYIRTEHRQVTSGLLEQKGVVHRRSKGTKGSKGAAKTMYTATSLAVTVEAFYRSAMNQVMNAQLSGKPLSRDVWEWFPKMHVQVPTRVLYIAGLKEIRRAAGEFDPRDRAISPGAVKLLLSFLPGVMMCPLSSVLEATHSRQNTEPFARRWTRGYSTRIWREIIFGIGINQLSDYCREHVPAGVENLHVRTAIGSIMSGVLSGYFSQIPHNISTMKLMEPHRSYGDLWKQLWRQSVHRVPEEMSGSARDVTAQFLAVAAPVGCLRRSIQIAGSFIIINGLLFKWRDKPWP